MISERQHETAMDFIKNKPNNDPVILGFEKENEVRYLTYEGKRITAAELSELVGYRVALVSVYNAPVLSIIGTNSGSIVTTMEVDAYLNVTYVHYRTAEYTPTT